jgi:nicotinate-nucleotide adenylyltransferase
MRTNPAIPGADGAPVRVALFGGSFNPPHVGHELAALYVLETAPVDELWFVPAFKHAFEKTLLPFEDRHQMCELAAAALGPRARVSDVERDLGGESRTLRTVRALQAQHPSHEFALVIGADLVGEVGSWYGAEELRRDVPFIVVGRSGAARASAGGAPAVEMPAVSSTEIRRALAAGEPVTGLVSRPILAYIYARDLFGARKPA